MNLSDLVKTMEAQRDASAHFSGQIGELALVQFAQKYLSDDYYILTDVVLKAHNGTTQIDQIIVSKFGLFVVEVKNYSGWIWGNAQDPQWTQTLNNGKYRFQNPLRQNYKHIKTLQSLLGYADNTFKSLIFFTSQTEFKTQMPNNVTNTGDDFIDFIEKHQAVLLSDEAVKTTLNHIIKNRLTNEEHQAHIQKIKEQYSNADENNSPQCPRCTQIMVLRTAKSGYNQGNKFWGCQSYPRCKAIVNINNDHEKKQKQVKELEEQINQFGEMFKTFFQHK